MRDALRFPVAAALLAASSTAWALPWNIDMVDAPSIKAYEAVMNPLPEGVVAQPNVLTPIAWRRAYVRESAEGQALANPYDASDKAVLDLGERMYGVYCTPCHGDGVELGPVAAPGRYPGVAVLAGPSGRLKLRTDGHVYLTIANGGGIMPSYGWAMSDKEMWAIVAWMRQSLPDAAAPAPVQTDAAPAAADDAAPAADGVK